MTRNLLALADGTLYEGTSFGWEGESEGELVFNTSMTGYQEILTDPSYHGQIVLMTSPMIGNYGINTEDVESEKPQVAGFIVKEYCDVPSNWRSTSSLGSYLSEHKIVAGEHFPTRNIVRKIREGGACPAVLSSIETNPQILLERARHIPTMVDQDFATVVTCKKSYLIPAVGKKRFRLAAMDYGIKRNILRELAKRGCDIQVLPAATSAQEILAAGFDGLILSNGPGDPAAVEIAIEHLKKMMGKIPMLGICLGHQLLALAMGATTFKLKFGHRGGNQPVKDLSSGKILITAQNHGFAVSEKKFPKGMEITQINLNDRTVEGFKHRELPIVSVQYHPEASPGPHDAANIFDQFLGMLCQSEQTLQKF